MEQSIDTSEQWLTDGLCDKCRRAKYCQKTCGARKRKQKAALVALESAVASRLTYGISDILGMYQ